VKTTHGENRVSALQVPPEQEFTVYRIVRTDIQDDPVFENSLRSNYEMGGHARGIERDWAVIHRGISVYLAPDTAEGTAQRCPKLGDYIARLRLRAGLGINFAHTGHPRHLTIWADPVKLAKTVVDIKPVER
jgi:hypothetical protein